jgi:hypothetical protein
MKGQNLNILYLDTYLNHMYRNVAIFLIFGDFLKIIESAIFFPLLQ